MFLLVLLMAKTNSQAKAAGQQPLIRTEHAVTSSNDREGYI